MLYRTSTTEDCQAVYDLICDMEAKALPYDTFETIYRKQLSDDHYECIVCEQNTGVIAMVNLRYEDQLHHAGRIAEIMEFVVKAGYRDKGYGKDLFSYACQRAEARGCIQIEVACYQLRKDTHRFYLREGMKNYHFKFSKGLVGLDFSENVLGR